MYSVGLDIMGKLLIIYPAFVRYCRRLVVCKLSIIDVSMSFSSYFLPNVKR